MLIIGWQLFPNTEGGDEALSTSSSSKVRSHERRRVANKGMSDSVRYMNAIRNAGSPRERMRAVVTFANTLEPEHFAKWVEGDLFTFCEGPELDVFRVILFDRWKSESPRSLIPWADKNRHGQAYRALKVLAAEQPEMVLEHYRGYPNNQAELLNLQWIAEKHPSMALQRLKELSSDGLTSDLDNAVGNLIRNLAKNATPELEAAMNELSPNMRKKAEIAVVGVRLEQSFSDEVEKLYDRSDGWSLLAGNLSNNKELGAKLLAQIDELPDDWIPKIANNYYNLVTSDNAKDWFESDLENLRFSSYAAKRIWGRALEMISYKDPKYALTNLSEASERYKPWLISRALSGAKGNTEKQQELIALMGSEKDKLLAQELLKIEKLKWNKEGEAQEPSAWLDVLGSLDVTGVKRPYTLLTQIRSWDKSQLAALKPDYNKLPIEQKQNIARVIAKVGRYNYYDVEFSGEAIKTLVTNPIPSKHNPFSQGGGYNSADPILASSKYVVWLSGSDPAAATSWLSSLPNGDAKLWASKNLAANWAKYDPKAVKKWMKTLPSDTKREVQKHMDK